MLKNLFKDMALVADINMNELISKMWEKGKTWNYKKTKKAPSVCQVSTQNHHEYGYISKNQNKAQKMFIHVVSDLVF